MTDTPTPESSLVAGFARGLVWTWLAIAATGLSSLFTVGWAVRRIGAERFGQYVLVVAILELLTIIEYGLGQSIIHATARSEEACSHQDRLTNRLAVRAAHGACAVAGGVVLALTCATLALQAFGVKDTGLSSIALLILGLAASLSVGTSAMPAITAGCRRFSSIAVASLMGAGVKTAAVALFVGRLGITGLAIAHVGKVLAERLYLARRLRSLASWFRLQALIPERDALRSVAVFTAPLLVLSISAQLFSLVDLVVLGTLAGASAVAFYQVGSLAPLQVRSLLGRGYGVSFPGIAAMNASADQESATLFLNRLFAYMGGAAFTLIAICRSEITRILLGRESALSEDVLLAFCIAGVFDVIVHGWVSLLIARGLQRLMARVVVIELPFNLLLTVVLVVAFGPVGAAISTVITVAMMDFLVFPLITRAQFSRPTLALLARDGILPAGLGGLASGAVGVLALRVSAGPWGQISIAAFGGLLAASGFGLLLLGGGGRTTLRCVWAPSTQSKQGRKVTI